MPLNANKPDPIVADLPKLKLTIRDVNPLSAVGAVMKIPINSLATVFSGLVSHLHDHTAAVVDLAGSSLLYNTVSALQELEVSPAHLITSRRWMSVLCCFR